MNVKFYQENKKVISSGGRLLLKFVISGSGVGQDGERIALVYFAHYLCSEPEYLEQ